MEVASSTILNCEDEEKALKVLLDSFGSFFTIEEIASAYCNAGWDADLAGRVLHEKQGSSIAASSLDCLSDEKRTLSSSSCSNGYTKLRSRNGDVGSTKQIWRPVSGSNASNDLVKDCIRSVDSLASTLDGDKNVEEDLISSEYLKDEIIDNNSKALSSLDCNISEKSSSGNGHLTAPKKMWRPVSGSNDSTDLVKDCMKSVDSLVNAVSGDNRAEEDSELIGSSSGGWIDKKCEVLSSSPCKTSEKFSSENGFLTTPKKIWRPVSGNNKSPSKECISSMGCSTDALNGDKRIEEDLVSFDSCNGETIYKKDTELPSCHRCISDKSSFKNGHLTAPKQVWRPVCRNDDSIVPDCSNSVDSLTDAFNGHKRIEEDLVSTDSSNSETTDKKHVVLSSSDCNIPKKSSSSNGYHPALKQIWRPISAIDESIHKYHSESMDSLKNVCQGNKKVEQNSALTIQVTKSVKTYNTVLNNRSVKEKWRPVSEGSASSVLGKGYVKYMPVANGSSIVTKPTNMKPLDNDVLHKDMEDFLFKMLGQGFKLKREVIRQVLDEYGYDMQQSMVRLIDLSSANFDGRSKHLGTYPKQFADACPNANRYLYQNRLQSTDSSGGKADRYSNGEVLSEKSKIHDLQKGELFPSSESSESPSRKVMGPMRSLTLGDQVVEAPTDAVLEYRTHFGTNQDGKSEVMDHEEDGYKLLRIAVKEHRNAMKEYYEAAVEAFVKGDHDQSKNLMEKGHLSHEKAREADEESSRKIFGNSIDSKTEDEMLLDLHDHGPKEALRLLKCHLSSLSAFEYLRIIIKADAEDSTGQTRRRLIVKLLEKECITWTEDEHPGTILVRLDKIDRKKLSFAKK